MDSGSSTVIMAADISLANRVKCPCDNFTAMSRIVEALDDSSREEKLESLLDWLAGGTDKLALDENKLLSCGKRSRCRFRYGTSFAILNAIRDACKPHLEKMSSHENGAVVSSPTMGIKVEEGFSKQSQLKTEPYEEAFPSLVAVSQSSASKPHPAAANILIPRKKKASSKPSTVTSKPLASTTTTTTTTTVASATQPNVLVPQKSKNKRRIRPAQVLEPVETKSVWSSSQSGLSSVDGPHVVTTGAWGVRNGTLSSVTSEETLKPVRKAIAFSPVKENAPRSNKASLESPYQIAPMNQASVNNPSKCREDSNALASTAVCSSTPVKSILPTVPLRHFENLLVVYTALFEHLLVPSTLLELHFLLRLITLDPESKASQDDSSTSIAFFQPIFASGHDCRKFAIQALRKLKNVLHSLPIQLLRKLVACEPFQVHCGDLVDELSKRLGRYEKIDMPMEYATEAVTGTHAILSLPFDEARDSRHNYKTKAEIAVYKNREESRDAFLQELRTYMGSKGKIFRPQDMERSQNQVRERAKDIMNRLLGVNMMWFAQFYSDLLLQVGLAPVQETDQELLNIMDKDKLQKLHKRFSSRSTHATKSSKKISISMLSSNTLKSPLEEAHQLFFGYQEYFFLFLHELPFNFGFHLRGRLAKAILTLLSDIPISNDLEKSIMKLGLLARFLGYLVFSPNWHDSAIDPSKIQSLAISNGLDQLENLGISMQFQIERAWVAGHLIVTVPWVTEMLKMAKWDSFTQSSRQYKMLLADMRHIQKAVALIDAARPEFDASMEIVSFSLERFFDETVGLPRLTSLPKSHISKVDRSISEDGPDRKPLGFSTLLLFASSPHFEDLLGLIEQAGKGAANKSPSRARKLRPSIVSRSLGVEPSKLFADGETGLLPTPIKDRYLTSNDMSDPGNTASIQSKLVEAFFHQHRVLKDICDFAVEQTLQRYSHSVVLDCMKSSTTLKNLAHEVDCVWTDQILANLQNHIQEEASAQLKGKLRNGVSKSIEIFGPSAVNETIIRVAIDLSVTSGILAGQNSLRSIIMDELKQQQKQQNVRCEDNLSDVGNTDCARVVGALDRIASLLHAPQAEAGEAFHSAIFSAVDSVSLSIRDFAEKYKNSVPAEDDIRAIASATLRLDNHGPRMLQLLESSSSDESFLHLFRSFLRLLLDIATITTLGIPSFSRGLSKQFIPRALGISSHLGQSATTTTKLVQQVVEQNLVDDSYL